MEFDTSLSGYELKKAFHIIRERTQRANVLIIRSDEIWELKMFRSCLRNNDDYLYLKLGVAFSMDKIYENLTEKIDNKMNSKQQKSRLVEIIVRKLGSGRGKVIVIDNCQYLMYSKIFRLIGLVLALYGKVQFIFLIPNDYAEELKEGVGEYRKGLFLKLIPFKYDLS